MSGNKSNNNNAPAFRVGRALPSLVMGGRALSGGDGVVVNEAGRSTGYTRFDNDDGDATTDHPEAKEKKRMETAADDHREEREVPQQPRRSKFGGGSSGYQASTQQSHENEGSYQPASNNSGGGGYSGQQHNANSSTTEKSQDSSSRRVSRFGGGSSGYVSDNKQQKNQQQQQQQQQQHRHFGEEEDGGQEQGHYQNQHQQQQHIGWGTGEEVQEEEEGNQGEQYNNYHQHGSGGGGDPSYQRGSYGRGGSGRGVGGQQKRLRHDKSYSEMNPEEKLKARRTERQEKKDRDRTLSYFKSIKTMMEEQQDIIRGATTTNTSSKEDPNASSSEAAAAASLIIDDAVSGFCTELTKMVKEDLSKQTFDRDEDEEYAAAHGGAMRARLPSLFRNATVCRATEMVLSHAKLRHLESLMFLFSGQITNMFLSPTASFVVETLFASTYLGLSAEGNLGDGDSGDAMAVMGEGDQDAILMRQEKFKRMMELACEEVLESITDLICHPSGSRCLRSLIMMLGGLPTRGVPLPANPFSFPTLLISVAEAAVDAIQQVFAPRHVKAGESERKKNAMAWFAACTTTTSSLVVQGLLATCGGISSDVDEVVRSRMESLTILISADDDEQEEEDQFNNHVAKPEEVRRFGKQSVLEAMMFDDVGSYVFQSFMKIQAPATVVTNAAEILRLRAAEKNEKKKTDGEPASGGPKAKKGKNAAPDEDFLRAVGLSKEEVHGKHHEESDEQATITKAPEVSETSVFSTAWDTAFRLILSRLETILKLAALGFHAGRKGSICAFLLQDCALFAPTALHLQKFWNDLIEPNLEVFLSSSILAGVLVKLTRKCAFSGSASFHTVTSSATTTTGSLEEATKKQIVSDERQGVPYFSVPADFKTLVCSKISHTAKTSELLNWSSKGICHSLLVDRCLGGGHSSAKVPSSSSSNPHHRSGYQRNYGGENGEEEEGDYGNDAVEESYQKHQEERGGAAAVGFELVANIIHFGRTSASHLLHTLDKLTVEDLVYNVAMHPQGTYVLQQYIKSVAGEAPTQQQQQQKKVSESVIPAKAVTPPPMNKKVSHISSSVAGTGATPIPPPAYHQGQKTSKQGTNPPPPPKTLIHKLFRRLEPHMEDLVTNRYGGFVLEVLYENAPVDVKEGINTKLALVYAKPEFARDSANLVGVPNSAVTGNTGVFFAKKVMLRCNLDQFIHRREDWKRLAERQANVKKMLHQILISEMK